MRKRYEEVSLQAELASLPSELPAGYGVLKVMPQ